MIAAGILVEALSRELPGDRLVTDPDVLAAMSHDEAEWAPAGKAVAGVRARSETEVQHGVGILKRDGMRRELDPGNLALQAAVRRALDPLGLFNPGKG